MKNVKTLLKWIKPYIFLFLMISLFSIIIPLTYSYVPQFIRYIFNALGKADEAKNTLPTFMLNYFDSFSGAKAISIVCITIALYQGVRGLLIFVNGYLKGEFAEAISLDIRKSLYKKIQNLPISFQNTQDVGDLIQRCTSDVETIRAFVSNQLPSIIYILTSIISGAIQMASINVNIMVISICCLPISLISSIIFFKLVSKRFEQIEIEEANMTSILEESINGVRVVKAFGKERHVIDKFDNKNKALTRENKKMANIMGLFWGFSDSFIQLQYAGIIGYCIYLATKGLPPGDIISCIAYISMLVYPIRNLGRIISDFGKASVSAKRVEAILCLDEEYIVNGTKKPKILGNIKFDHVSFKFDDDNKYLFDDLSFEIKAGETVAIVGKTGSGKSTIANLFVRMLEYDNGIATIDGIDIKDIDKHHLRENVGIILQEPFLYQKTIYENIGIALKQVNDEEIIRAAKIAAIDSDIKQFEKGYQTLVGEKGVTLSGGQKQRLAISRMLVLNKPIMIFDDSLSAVDTKTDLQIRNALKQRDEKLTTIIITHRITTAKEADKIIVLENGKVTDIGTHEELSQKEGLYKSLWDIQGALEEEFLKLVESDLNK